MTPKQARFVEEYLQDLNATQAAMRAGYSRRSANEQGAQLLKRPQIAAAIEARKAARSERTQIDADWVLKRLVEEAEADVADLYDDAGNLLPVEDWPLIWRQGLVAGIDTEVIRADGVEIGTVQKVRLSDRVRRLEMIGKHVGVKAFEDQVTVHASVDLAARLQRATIRIVDADPLPVSTAPAVTPTPAPVERLPVPEPIHAAPVPAGHTALPSASSDDAVIAAKPSYTPVLDWPDQRGPAFADINYEAFSDGLLAGRNR